MQMNTLIGHEDRAFAPQFASLRPDFTVQYGYVANPEKASGGLGAMLQGKNPAAGALPWWEGAAATSEWFQGPSRFGFVPYVSWFCCHPIAGIDRRRGSLLAHIPAAGEWMSTQEYYQVQPPCRSLDDCDRKAYGESGTRGRLGLGADLAHPEGPGNPSDWPRMMMPRSESSVTACSNRFSLANPGQYS
jgi:hypothetical protein